MASSPSMAQSISQLREIRSLLGLSQAECAAALGVAVETFRTWDAGRRPAPDLIVERAKTLKEKRSTHERVPLRLLAHEFHVNVRTLRAAARDGRLIATFSPRPYLKPQWSQRIEPGRN
jgi:transcriptional regulator with XRE-family HTH domain